MSRRAQRQLNTLAPRRLAPHPSPRQQQQQQQHQRSRLTTLAIETSCDDTAVAVLLRSGRRHSLLFNERISSDNRAFQGINPAVAVQSHNASLAKLVLKALRDVPPPDFVCATRGPGIMSNLAVGLNMAKGLAVAWGVPLLGVHHMQAHALTPRLMHALAGDEDEDLDQGVHRLRPAFPFLSLLVSGGHTLLVHSTGLTAHRVVAQTADVAVGNMLDQAARAILPPSVLDACPDVNYGRALEAFAFDADGDLAAAHAGFFRPAASRAEEMVPQGAGIYPWELALPLRDSRRLAYSFSSIRTAVDRIVEHRPHMAREERVALARHAMRAAFQHLAGRLVLALEDVPGLRDATTLVVSGGVASNRFLMHVLRTTLAARGFPGVRILAPPAAFCTDNAAMVAWAGMEMWDAGWESDLGVLPVGKWPLEVDGADGIMGAGGWVRRA